MKQEVSECLHRLPKKVKLGPYDWRIVLQDGHSDHCGMADFEEQTIQLWGDDLTSPGHCVGIFLHECLHVIYDNRDLGNVAVGLDLEETVVIGFEHGLIQLFRDNTKLLTWMKKGLK